MKKSLLLVLVAALGGCAQLPADTAYQQDSLKLFAFDLGRTHAGLAACPEVRPDQLDAHLESARIALQGQARSRLAELTPVFEHGLHSPAASGERLHIECDCASQIVEESRRHNLRLYRQVALPKVYSGQR
jgi:hypothetical protein